MKRTGVMASVMAVGVMAANTQVQSRARASSKRDNVSKHTALSMQCRCNNLIVFL